MLDFNSHIKTITKRSPHDTNSDRHRFFRPTHYQIRRRNRNAAKTSQLPTACNTRTRRPDPISKAGISNGRSSVFSGDRTNPSRRIRSRSAESRNGRSFSIHAAGRTGPLNSAFFSSPGTRWRYFGMYTLFMRPQLSGALLPGRAQIFPGRLISDTSGGLLVYPFFSTATRPGAEYQISLLRPKGHRGYQ